MSKFKVGDRVAVYTYSGRSVGHVTEVYRHGALMRVNAGGAFYLYHSKQCRKLKKKEEYVWVPRVHDSGLHTWEWYKKAPSPGAEYKYIKYKLVKV